MLIINIKIDMNIKSICLIALLIVASLSQKKEMSPETDDFVSIQKTAEVQDQKEQKEIQQKIPPFLLQQLKQVRQQKTKFKGVQAFIISLASQQTFDFRYKIQSNPNPSFITKIFTQQTQDDISYIKNHQEDNYLQIFSSTTLLGTHSSVAKAYMHKFIQLGSHSGSQLFIRLVNKFDFQVIVQVTLSGPPAQIDRFTALKNSQFSILAKKIEAIQSQMKQVEALNRNKFKFEWGFLEREQHYQEQMLKLTGFEAIVIFATSIVQVCCIKSLIDKNIVI